MEIIRIRDFNDKRIIMPANNIAFIEEYENTFLPVLKSRFHLKSEKALFLSRTTIEEIDKQMKESKNTIK